MGASIYKNKKPAMVFLIPAFLFMIVYLYYPFLQNIWNHLIRNRQDNLLRSTDFVIGFDYFFTCSYLAIFD